MTINLRLGKWFRFEFTRDRWLLIRLPFLGEWFWSRDYAPELAFEGWEALRARRFAD